MLIVRTIQAKPFARLGAMCLGLILAAAGSVQAQSTAAKTATEGVLVNAEAVKLLPSKYSESGRLVAAYDPHIPPMSFQSEKGKPAGVEPEIVVALGKALGLEIDFRPASTEPAVAGLQSGRYDLAVGSYVSNENRLKYADIISYAKYGQGIATQPENSNLTFDTLCGRSVATTKGNVQQLVIVPALTEQCKATGHPPLNELVFPDESAIFLALLSGRVEAALLNEVTIRLHSEQSHGKMVLAQGGYSSSPRGILIQKNGLAPALMVAIQKLADDGVLEDIFERGKLDSVSINKPLLNTLH